MWENKTSRIINISLLALLGVVVLIYEYGVVFSTKYYYPGTVINGVQAGGKESAYVEDKLYENPANYNIDVIFRDKTYKINGAEINLKTSYMKDLKKVKEEQKPYLWVNTLFENEYKVDKEITYDEAMLVSIVDGFESLDKDNMVEPSNATIELGDDGVVRAVNGDPGTVIEDRSKIYDIIEEAIDSQATEVKVEDSGCYKVADYTSESAKVKKCVEYCNTIAGLDIRYLYGTEEVPFEPFQLFGMIRISDDYDTIISKNKVKMTLEGFSRMHDTYNKVRQFKNHDNKMINITNSDYGWLIDIETETDALYSDVVHHKNVTRSPEFLEQGFTYDAETGDDVGGTFAEVNLDKQMMYFYKNKRLILYTDVVTGCLRLNHGTPAGIYDVDFKQSPAVLRGPDYESKVTYWMPFNGGIGFHDATWRSKFGGEIYFTNGSHGCVNMPFAKAQELYPEVEDGMPVIVY